MGAWIETEKERKARVKAAVAPRVGAWIETLSPHHLLQEQESHPEWVRGLKPI